MRKENQKNKSLNSDKGFTLIELLVAMTIFSIIVLATVAAFGSGMRSQKKAREIQNNVAAAKTAIDLMAKTMRMSKNLGPNGSGTAVYMYNSSQNKCIKYQFNGGNLEMSEYGNPSGPSSCSGGYSGYITIIPGVTGRFDVTQTVTTSPFRIGKAAILVNIGNDHLETAISFRDYEGIVQ